MKKLIIKLVSIFFLAAIFIIAAKMQSGWIIKGQLPTPRYGSCSTELEGAIYVIGGVESDMADDDDDPPDDDDDPPDDDDDTADDDDGILGYDEDNNDDDVTVLSDDDSIDIIEDIYMDDDEITDIIEKYDAASNSWDTNIGKLNVERYNAASVGFNGKIYIIGGRNDDGIVNEIEIYDPDANKWETASHHLCKKREGAAAVVYDGKIYIIGGYNSNGEYLGSVEVFDPQKEKWEKSAQSMKFPRTALAAVVSGESIYALGGFSYGPLAVVEKFEPGVGWQTKTSMTIARGNFAASVIDSIIYIMGGQSPAGTLAATEAYDPATDSWTSKEPMNSPREGFAAQAVDNKIYVFGGSNSEHQFIAEVEEYTPAPSAVVINEPTVPGHFLLHQNYPNPFNNQTVIKYYSASSSQNSGLNRVNLIIYNLRGQRVVTLVDEYQTPGDYQLRWNGTDAAGTEQASGVYFCVLKAGTCIQTIKLILAR